LTNRKLKSLELLHEWWKKCKATSIASTVLAVRSEVLHSWSGRW